MGNKPSVRRLRSLILSTKVDVVGIAEPIIPFQKAGRLMKKIGMSGVVSNGEAHGHKLWVFWRQDAQVRVMDSHEQFVTLECRIGSEKAVLVSFVHALCSFYKRWLLWNALLDQGIDASTPWAISGDFNAILSPGKKVGGRQMIYRASPFKFQQMWITHPGFKECVRLCWENQVYGLPLQILYLKLKALHIRLKAWNKSVFGNIHQNARNAEDMVVRAEIEAEQAPSDDSRRALKNARTNLHDVLLQEEIFWKQKSRVRWLKKGERNTIFFHTAINVQRCIGRVEKIRDANGEWIQGTENIALEVARFFADAFSSQGVTQDADLLDFIPRVVTDEDNAALLHIPSLDEVKEAVFALSQDSAPGPDGFSGYFFTSCWEIIGGDVWRAIEDFFLRGLASKGIHISKSGSHPQKGEPRGNL
ncbi:uncharacterized protein LOC122672341 [Telopea speciosissima]|uniref:uncharacterized protein LOC122672341 n=1 Tax=Telopea speciosissima TaxID=54955 RepID=UPI001CC401C7|nr:uncharacterized protein LOC122672341 [Telopea speciosissima]